VQVDFSQYLSALMAQGFTKQLMNDTVGCVDCRVVRVVEDSVVWFEAFYKRQRKEYSLLFTVSTVASSSQELWDRLSKQVWIAKFP
jgi:hypothetical protein